MNLRNKVRNSLKYSFLDGVFASSMAGMITDYITPYALFLNASTRSIGALNAMPNLFSSLVQLKSPDVVDRIRSRKKLINVFVFLHTLMLLPIIFLPYMRLANPVGYLVILIALFTCLNAFCVPAWASLMSEYIPSKMRGEYFGWRNKVLGMVAIIASLASGLILHYSKKHNILAGFTIIFSCACFFRLISWYFVTQMYEPVFKVKKEAYFTFFDFVKKIKKSNFAKFVFFVAVLNFCVNLASPFFSVFMIRDLKFNYITYMSVMAAVSVTTIFTIGRWGKLADTIGNLKVLKITSLFIASLPLWWLFCRHPAYLVFVQMLSGFAWAGFNLCAMNFIYDAVTPEKRTRCIAYFNFCSGIGLFAGALFGGSLANILPPIFGYRLLTLFLVSCILRLSTALFFTGKIKEVRHIQKLKSKDLFYSFVGLKTSLGEASATGNLLKEDE